MVKEALTNAKLWEARYTAVEKSRKEYRENTKKLITNNESLQSAVDQVDMSRPDTWLYLNCWCSHIEWS